MEIKQYRALTPSNKLCMIHHGGFLRCINLEVIVEGTGQEPEGEGVVIIGRPIKLSVGL